MGVVHVFDLDEPKVEKNEAMITNLAFLSPEELRERRETLESWSQICLDGLGEPAGEIGSGSGFHTIRAARRMDRGASRDSPAASGETKPYPGVRILAVINRLAIRGFVHR
jgi:hypothetical protein